MPNVLLEAAAMSVPVVATSVTGCVDVVDDGETGRLVPPRDAQALADAIIAYLECESERVRVGNNARHHVLEKYQPVDLLQALQDEYSRQWRMKAARNRR